MLSTNRALAGKLEGEYWNNSINKLNKGCCADYSLLRRDNICFHHIAANLARDWHIV